MTETTTARAPRLNPDALPGVVYIAPEDLPAWTFEIPERFLRLDHAGWAYRGAMSNLHAWLEERGLRMSLLLLESVRVARGLKTPGR